MRELWPQPVDDLDPLERYASDVRSPGSERPWVIVNMIATVDGGTAVDGVSGGLGGPGDKTVFRAVRAVPDMILVGAGTVRAEHYGPPRPSREVRAAREARGQSPAPRLAVVSARTELDPGTPLFAEAEEPPIVLTGNAADPDRLAALSAVAEVVVGDHATTTATEILGALQAWGAGVVLCEGGPSLNGQLVAEGLIDEWCLSVSPRLVGGTSPRAAHGPAGVPSSLRLDRVLADDDGYLFLRYLRA